VFARHVFNYRYSYGYIDKARKLVGVDKGNKQSDIHVVQCRATWSEIRMNYLFHKFVEIQPINTNFNSSAHAA
jgi:hypothetical protein